MQIQIQAQIWNGKNLQQISKNNQNVAKVIKPQKYQKYAQNNFEMQHIWI